MPNGTRDRLTVLERDGLDAARSNVAVENVNFFGDLLRQGRRGWTRATLEQGEERDPSSRGSIDASASFAEASAPKTTTPGARGRGGRRVEGRRGEVRGMELFSRGRAAGAAVVRLRPPFPPLEQRRVLACFSNFSAARWLRGDGG